MVISLLGKYMMKKKKISRQIIIFFIIITVINAISILGWLLIRYSPVVRNINSFKNEVSIIMREEYSDMSSFTDKLDSFLDDKNILYVIEDNNRNLVFESGRDGILLFSDIVNINDKSYFINFLSSKKINLKKLIIEGCIFQILEVTFLIAVVYFLIRRKIINPTESIIEDIKNYRFGRKPSRRLIGGELGLIQNEFVNLTNELDNEKREQNRIIASISHDIKTPLTSILGYADLIMEEEDISLIRKYNGKINDKALHLKEILSSFDDYLVNYDNSSLKLSSVLIKDIINDLNDSYKIELENNNISFNINSKIGNERINVDVVKLKRIFSNLISNSARYLSDGGNITINISDNQSEYIFTVSDNGPGIDNKIIDKIFDPFYTTDRSRKISGLGLSICREFTNMHKGEISAYNDNGLTIRFTISKNIK